ALKTRCVSVQFRTWESDFLEIDDEFEPYSVARRAYRMPLAAFVQKMKRSKFRFPQLSATRPTPHSSCEWFIAPFRRARETHRERTGIVPTRLIRIRPRPIRNDRGSCQ